MPEMDYANRHRLKEHDFAVFEDFGFEYAPVGLKFFNVEEDVVKVGLKPLEEPSLRAGAVLAWASPA